MLHLLPPESSKEQRLEISIEAVLQNGAVLQDIASIIFKQDAELHGLFIVGKCTRARPVLKKQKKPVHTRSGFVSWGLPMGLRELDVPSVLVV